MIDHPLLLSLPCDLKLQSIHKLYPNFAHSRTTTTAAICLYSQKTGKETVALMLATRFVVFEFCKCRFWLFLKRRG